MAEEEQQEGAEWVETTTDTADTGTGEREYRALEVAAEKSSESAVVFVRRGREVWGKATFELQARGARVEISMRGCTVERLVANGAEYTREYYAEMRDVDDPLCGTGTVGMQRLAWSLGAAEGGRQLVFVLGDAAGAEEQRAVKVELWYRLENTAESALVGLREVSVGGTQQMQSQQQQQHQQRQQRHWYSDGAADQADFWLPHIPGVSVAGLQVVARRELVVFGPGNLERVVDGAVYGDSVRSVIEEVTGGKVPCRTGSGNSSSSSSNNNNNKSEGTSENTNGIGETTTSSSTTTNDKSEPECVAAEKYAVHSFHVRGGVEASAVGVAVGPFWVQQGADGRDLKSCVVNGCLAGRDTAEVGTTVGDLAERALGFFGRLMPGAAYPWGWYHQVFVHDAGLGTWRHGAAFAGLAVLPEELLHGAGAAGDLCFRAAEAVAECVAAQWFGVSVQPAAEAEDRWLVTGLRAWAARRYLREVFGADYARMRDFRDADELMEKRWGRPLVPGVVFEDDALTAAAAGGNGSNGSNGATTAGGGCGGCGVYMGNEGRDAYIHASERQDRRYELKAYFAVMTFAEMVGLGEFQAQLAQLVRRPRRSGRRHGHGSNSNSNSSTAATTTTSTGNGGGGGGNTIVLSSERFIEHFAEANPSLRKKVELFRKMWVYGHGFPPLSCGVSVNQATGHKTIEFCYAADLPASEKQQWQLRQQQQQQQQQQYYHHGYYNQQQQQQQGLQQQVQGAAAAASTSAAAAGAGEQGPAWNFKVTVKGRGKVRSLQFSNTGSGYHEFKPNFKDVDQVSVRLDANFTFPQRVRFPVPAKMLEYALPERRPDIRGAYEAVRVLSYRDFRGGDTLGEGCEALRILGRIAGSSGLYWDLRGAAMHAMMGRAYAGSGRHFGAEALLGWYGRAYGDAAYPVAFGPGTGRSVHDYLAQREAVLALGEARTTAGRSPDAAVRFVLDLFMRVDTTPAAGGSSSSGGGGGGSGGNRYGVAALCRALGTFAYGNDGMFCEACGWLARWLAIDWRAPGHGNAVLCEAVRALVLMSLPYAPLDVPDAEAVASLGPQLGQARAVLARMLAHPTSPTLRVRALEIYHDCALWYSRNAVGTTGTAGGASYNAANDGCYGYQNNCNNNNNNNDNNGSDYGYCCCCCCWGPAAATAPISDEVAGGGIQYAVRVLIDALAAPSPRVRMRAAELIRELYATLEAQESSGPHSSSNSSQQHHQPPPPPPFMHEMQYQRLSPVQTVRGAICSAQGMYFLELIRNTRDSLFRGALIDIFSIGWRYTELYPYSDFAR